MPDQGAAGRSGDEREIAKFLAGLVMRWELNRVQFGKCSFGGVVRRVWGLRAARGGLFSEQKRSPSPRERLFRTMVVAAESTYFVVGGVGVGRCLGAVA